MDSCVLPTRHHGYYLVQTTDLYPYALIVLFVTLTTSSFYPLVEDPYFQVKFDCYGDVGCYGNV